jgi:predicted Zn-dependent protease
MQALSTMILRVTRYAAAKAAFVICTATLCAAQTPAPNDLSVIRKSIDTGHADLALTQIAQLRKTQPTSPGLDRMEGLAFYAKGDLRSADTHFAAARAADPHDIESAQMRGLTLFRLGRPADAIPLLESSRTGPISKADPNYVLALCYMDTRRYDDARHAFAAQYGFVADSAAAFLVSARMLLRREYLPVAQQFAEKALELDPGLPLAHELLGEIALAGNHLDIAITELEQERVRNPLEGAVYDRLGDAYVRSARYDDAQRTLQQAILLQPNTTGAYILLGKTLLKKTDPLGAATYLERAVHLDSANYMAHSLLGQAYRSMGRTDDAARETAEAQRLQGLDQPKIESEH